MMYQNTLPNGTVLAGDYTIKGVLGSGGFGNTYLAEDASLRREVAIKEYFPNDIVVRTGNSTVTVKTASYEKNFKWGMERFVREAQTLAKFRHPHIVRVFRTFDGNETAYIVLELVKGQAVGDWLKKLNRKPNQNELDKFLAPLLDALSQVHEGGILHRDIKPENIYVREGTYEPVLLDFGAARFAVGEKRGTTAAIVSRGYSPHEAYSSDHNMQGPWTDIYGLAATVYFALTGKDPPESTARVLEDTHSSMADLVANPRDYRPGFLNAIDSGLRVFPKDRPQSVAEWAAQLFDADLTQPSAPRTSGPISVPSSITQQDTLTVAGQRRSNTAGFRSSQEQRKSRLSPILGAMLVLPSAGVLALWQTDNLEPAKNYVGEFSKSLLGSDRKSTKRAEEKSSNEGQEKTRAQQLLARLREEELKSIRERSALQRKLDSQKLNREAEERKQQQARQAAAWQARKAEEQAAKEEEERLEREKEQRRRADEIALRRQQDEELRRREEEKAEAERQAREREQRLAALKLQQDKELEEERRKREEQEARRAARLRPPPPDQKRQYLSDIQSTLQTKNCIDDGQTPSESSVQSGIDRLADQVTKDRTTTWKSIRVATASVQEFENWIGWLRSLGSLCEPDRKPPVVEKPEPKKVVPRQTKPKTVKKRRSRPKPSRRSRPQRQQRRSPSRSYTPTRPSRQGGTR